MRLKVGKKDCAELDTAVFRRLLTFYPEERLLDRPKLAAALAADQISYRDLCAEAETLFIPWQMFFLKTEKLRHHLRNIEKNRIDRIKPTHLAKRKGADGDTPYRLIDRYIRAQNFVARSGEYPSNPYNGCLSGLSVNDAVAQILHRFSIERKELWAKSTKALGLEYLVTHVEAMNVNVGIGTADARLVPTSDNHRRLYKNVSGFCLKDDHVPFIYVNASMATEEEPLGRQIYTLIYLLTLIGLDEYTIARNTNPRTVSTIKGGQTRQAHDITSELLMPAASLQAYKEREVDLAAVSELSEKFKTTPSAVLMRLLRLRYITREEYASLKPPAFSRKSVVSRTARIDRAVKKLNGGIVVQNVGRQFATGALTQNRAQYILFGRIGRDTWRQYRTRTGI